MFEKKSAEAFVPNRASFKKVSAPVAEPKPLVQPTPVAT
jgi:hypothetical protein